MGVATHWTSVSLPEVATIPSQERQMLTPGVSNGGQISMGHVVMPPGHATAPHKHNYDMTIVVLEGTLLTLIGNELEQTIQHTPGGALLIPAGVPHVSINPSSEQRVVYFDCRATPVFGDDVDLLPHLNTTAEEATKHYQSRFIEPDDRRTFLEVF